MAEDLQYLIDRIQKEAVEKAEAESAAIVAAAKAKAEEIIKNATEQALKILGDMNADRESFRKIKALGYDVGQTAGCAIPFAEFGQIAREEGIEICGTHDSFNHMVDDPKTAMEEHKALGTTNMGIGGCHAQNEGVEGIERFIE